MTHRHGAPLTFNPSAWMKDNQTWKSVWMCGVMGSVAGGLVLFPPQLWTMLLIRLRSESKRGVFFVVVVDAQLGVPA